MHLPINVLMYVIGTYGVQNKKERNDYNILSNDSLVCQ